MRREALRRRRRPALGAALWAQFHEWVRDDTVEAVIIQGTQGVYILQSGAWREATNPFLREQQVRELLRRLTLNPRRERRPVYATLPEGFELFSWEDRTVGEPTLLLRRTCPPPLAAAQLDQLWRCDPRGRALVTRALSSREPVLVCGPGQHARELVLVALSRLLDAPGRAVWLVDAARPLPVAHAAAVVRVDVQRLHGSLERARDALRQVLALSPDWIVAQDAPAPLLLAVAQELRSARWGFLAAAAFPLRRRLPARPGRTASAWSHGLPETFRWVVEVGGYRRPVVEGLWRAAPTNGFPRTWRRVSPGDRTAGLRVLSGQPLKQPGVPAAIGTSTANGPLPAADHVATGD